EKDGATLMAQVVALRKGEEEGLILLIADSVATLEKYSDPWSAMVKSIGAPKAQPKAAGAVDLKYTTPEGWKSQVLEAGVLLTRTIDNAEFRLLLLPSQPLQSSLCKTF